MLLTGENKGRQGKQTETGYIRKQKEVQKQDNVTNVPFPSLRNWGARWGAILYLAAADRGGILLGTLRMSPLPAQPAILSPLLSGLG